MEKATPPAAGASASKRRRRPRSLLLLLKSLTGLRVRIDLKNDCIVEGVVAEVLHDMDFTLVDAQETKPNGKRVLLDEVFVMGRTVLFVHIPDRINLNQHLQHYLRMLRQSREMYTRDKRKAPAPSKRP
ncbi:hypothetical protein P43SY_000274 [Pythium insidiosum]|uniref:Sm domain-containing protein n=1 Tax=Pythium insidiosum TaxID=114742 RepID=A0AAD5LLG3_PYTIN|nr:hypothetical protein P43SY_000274 [Pythium insidiosum]KAJ0409574.1 hypothetical protein ATCC90586_010085 [Pythium insidiosum]